VLVFSFTAAFAIGDDEEVTGLLPITTLVLLLLALAMFRTLQTTAFRSIQLAATLDQVVHRGREVLLGIYTEEIETRTKEPEAQPEWSSEAPPGIREVRWPHRSRVLQVIDVPRLVRSADRAGAVIEFRVITGDTILENGLVALIHGETNESLEQDILKSLTVGPERTFEQDPGLAFRALTDIALRALSPAINDPTTASQALDASDSLLRLLATRDLDVGCIRRPDGNVRVVLPLPMWDDYVGLALDEVLSIGLRSLQIRRRLERLLAELHDLAPPDRRAAVRRRLDTVRAAPAQDPATPAGHE